MPTITSDAGARSLLCAVICRAVKDAQGGNGYQAEALGFLAGPLCAGFLAWLDLEEYQADLVAVARGEKGAKRPEKARQLGLFAWAGDPPRARATMGDRR